MSERKRLGNSDLDITRIGVGAWAMGGSGWAFAWGEQDDNDSIAAIRAALDAGVNWIDTAAVYGLGHSEEVVARALHGVSNRPYIFTKCERRWDENGKIFPSLKAESIRKECEASLRRLKVDAIDLYQVHWPEPDQDVEEGWTEMARLKEEGKVRWIGVSNFNAAQMERALRIAPVTSLQPPYSLLVRDIEQEILPFAHQNNIGVIVYSPMRNGLLSGGMTKERAKHLPQDDWRSRNPDFQEPKLSRNLELVELLRKIGARHGRAPGEVAIAWTLSNPAVTAAIVGLRKADQVAGVVGALGFRLSAQELSELEEFASSKSKSAIHTAQ
ncbi:MAG TPA: aldo/keto reductase [Bryobacteraceae bacterium]|jgi:aryl-alcohol dehydrogenase-like predicted oxidoreductase|nr:aldo/keto reductase [Bryobacteraceae bacterium]